MLLEKQDGLLETWKQDVASHCCPDPPSCLLTLQTLRADPRRVTRPTGSDQIPSLISTPIIPLGNMIKREGDSLGEGPPAPETGKAVPHVDRPASSRSDPRFRRHPHLYPWLLGIGASAGAQNYTSPSLLREVTDRARLGLQQGSPSAVGRGVHDA